MNLIETIMFKPYYPAFEGDEDPPENPFKDWKQGDKIPDELQNQLNSVLKTEREKRDKVITDLKTEIETLSKRSNFTKEEKEELEARVGNLQSELMTKEEKAKAEAKRLEKERDEAIQNLTTERDSWRSRFESDRIRNSIVDAAMHHKAYNPSQIHTLLRDEATMKEVLGDDGKPTGEYAVVVNVETVDEETKKTKKLEMSPQEAVEHIKKIEDHQNLFKSDGTGGIGGNNLPTDARGVVDMAQDPETYRKNRDKIVR